MTSMSLTRRQIGFALLSFGFGWMLLVFLAGVAELILRMSGFHYSTIPRQVAAPLAGDIIAAMNREMGTMVFEKDLDLLWRLVPGTKIGVQEINGRGFPGRSVLPGQQGRLFTLACLGDSCTALGLDANPYPERLKNDLDLVLGKDDCLVMNAGVPGYSSRQGLILLRKLFRDYRFDMVTIYYGWNDHWKAFSMPDKAFQPLSPLVASAQNILFHLKSYQALLYLFKHRSRENEAGKEKPLRVALPDFVRNLEEMVSLCRTRGSLPVLLTAPIAASLGGPDFDLLPQHDEFLLHQKEESRLHRQYCQAVRQFAGRTKTALVDLEKIFDDSKDSFLFMDDGIHLAPAGAQLVSDSLFEFLIGQGKLSGETLALARTRRTFTGYRPHIMRAELRLSVNRFEGIRGGEIAVSILAKNTGDTLWNRQTPFTFAAVTMGVRLLAPNGKVLNRDFGRLYLPADCPPGGEVRIDGHLKLPDTEGDFILEFDPVNEGVGWFRKWGSSPVSAPLLVRAR
jgi:lysophospholipase L1-like esterase